MAGIQFAKVLNKEYGKGTVTDGSDIFRIPTGIFNLDAASGGGIPKGHFTLLGGNYSGGKTLTALKTIANAQLFDRTSYKPLQRTPEGAYITEDGEIGQPMRTVYIDPEGSVTYKWAKTVGVDIDPDLFVLVNTKFQQQCYDIMWTAISSGQFDIIVLDSIAAMAPEEETEKSASEWSIGLAARINNKGIRVAQGKMNELKAKELEVPAVILINQIREDIGAYGNPVTFPGGAAQNFHSSLTVEFRPKKPVEINKVMVGRESVWKISKNKINGVQTSGSFITYIKNTGVYHKGDVDHISQVVEVAVRLGFIKVGGAWYTFAGENFQGKASVEEYLMANPEIFRDLRDDVMRRLQEENE